MKLLAIETTGAKASAALLDEEGKLTVQKSEETMNHLQHLLPMIQELLSKCGMSIDDVSVLAVSQGPGSFTGIRIGMATAKALAQVLELPVIGVPTLRAFAWKEPGYAGLVCPIFDARRNQIYAGIYDCDGSGDCVSLLEDDAYDIQDYVNGLRNAVEEAIKRRNQKAQGTGEGVGERNVLSITLFGDGISLYGETIQNAVEAWKTGTDSLSLKGDLCLNVAPESLRFQDAGSVALLGEVLFQQGKAASLFELHPVYLRKAEAERKLEEAEKKK